VIADTSYEGYTDIPRFIQQGYLTMFDEVRSQMAEDDFIFPIFFSSNPASGRLLPQPRNFFPYFIRAHA